MSSINKDGCSCCGGVTHDARGIGIIGVDVWKFEFTTIEDVGFIKEKDV